MGERTQRLLDALREWCNEKYGRQTEVGKAIGVSPQTVSNWLAIPPRNQLMGEHALAIQEFLQKHRAQKGKRANQP